MAEPKLVGPGMVIVMNYTLRNDGGEVLDSSTPEEPMAYLHGAENIVPGLEKALEGKPVGFTGKVVVEPAEGYGERDDEQPSVISRDSFPADLEIEVGMTFIGERDDDDEQVELWVVGLEGDNVLVESQHPLAGQRLHFEVEVLAIRPATADELRHGHPHGADGHAGHHH